MTPPSGALLDHFRPKPILIAGNLTSALGYAGFAFVDRPWQAFACAVAGGAGVGAARTANQTLLITLVTPEQRAASFALGRVASNLGLGLGATVAGFIVASAQHPRSFQTLYLFDAITYAALAAGDPSYRTVRGILAAGAERDQLPAAAGDGGAAAFLRGPGIDQERQHACLDRPEVVRPVAVPGEHRVTRADPQRVPGAEPGEQPNQAWLVVDAGAPAGEAGAGQGKTLGTRTEEITEWIRGIVADFIGLHTCGRQRLSHM